MLAVSGASTLFPSAIMSDAAVSPASWLSRWLRRWKRYSTNMRPTATIPLIGALGLFKSQPTTIFEVMDRPLDEPLSWVMADVLRTTCRCEMPPRMRCFASACPPNPNSNRRITQVHSEIRDGTWTRLRRPRVSPALNPGYDPGVNRDLCSCTTPAGRYIGGESVTLREQAA